MGVPISGDEAWPPGCSLKFVGGEQFGHRDRVMVDALQPNAVADISVELASPQQTGIYQGQWRMSTPLGFYFGGKIFSLLILTRSMNIFRMRSL